MPVYNGNSKAKDLYYGGAKIKEAYYGNTKVYSSGPLYYCYRMSIYGLYYYVYLLQKPTTPGSYTVYKPKNNTYPASSSADLVSTETFQISSVSESSFSVSGGYVWNYYQSGDLYT